jgi:hypothetical protein
VGEKSPFSGRYYPIDEKVGGLQIQGGRSEAVVIYCEILPTRDLESLRLATIG